MLLYELDSQLGSQVDQMAMLLSLFILFLNSKESSSCDQKEFTETPIEIQNSCDSTENIENRWRGELSYTRRETLIEVDWKNCSGLEVCQRNGVLCGWCEAR